MALALAACGDGGGSPTGGGTDATGADTPATDTPATDTPTTAATDTPPTSSAGTTGDDTGASSGDATTGAPPPEVVPLGPADHLLRASMALRGVRPGADELLVVAADPDSLPGFVDAYLEDDRFAETVKDLYAEALLLRAQLNGSMLPYVAALDGYNDARYLASIPEEPLKLIEAIVRDPSRSFAEIVTTDEVWVDEAGAGVWRVAGYDAQTGGWQPVHWADDRPQGGGVLASSALWHRHRSNGNNYQRVRANLVARVFLCEDYLTRDVPPFPAVDFSDPVALQDALEANPGCQSCHQTLDPLASFFWGAQSRGKAAVVNSYDAMGVCIDGKQATCYPLEEYILTQENKWKTTSGRGPGYFGEPTEGGNLDELGEHLAADPRFSQCVARRFYSYMAQVPLDAVPFALVDRLDVAFHVGDRLDVRALVRALVLSDEFRASHGEDATTAEGVVGLKLARPEQLERMFFDLTGFRWLGKRPSPNGDIYGDFPLLASDVWGYRAMAGGIDGYSITQPTWTFNPTRTLVLQALAAEAAGYVVDRDLDTAMKDQRKLLTLVDEAASKAVVRNQLAELHARVLGELVAADSPEVDESFALWSGVDGDARQKWKILLTAMFQDHRVAFY